MAWILNISAAEADLLLPLQVSLSLITHQCPWRRLSETEPQTEPSDGNERPGALCTWIMATSLRGLVFASQTHYDSVCFYHHLSFNRKYVQSIK